MTSTKPPNFGISQSGNRYYEDWRVKVDGVPKRVYNHRLLAVALWGFDAVADKEIHHKNGIPWDNRPSNLSLVSSSEHQRIEWGADWSGDWRDEELLRELYKSHTLQEIADNFGCTIRTIHYWFEKFGIERRGSNEDPPERSDT
jgi:hypothetical protein